MKDSSSELVEMIVLYRVGSALTVLGIYCQISK